MFAFLCPTDVSDEDLCAESPQIKDEEPELAHTKKEGASEYTCIKEEEQEDDITKFRLPGVIMKSE